MIRPARSDDAQQLAAVHVASIRGLCAADYAAEQIAAWTASLRPERYPPLIARGCAVVHDDGEALAGFAIGDPAAGVVNAVYVRPDRAGRGVGRALVAAIEDIVRAGGAAELRLHATLNAVGFYQRLGFAVVGPGHNRLPGGAELPCVVMTKPGG
jgi:putative acetyltransferase